MRLLAGLLTLSCLLLPRTGQAQIDEPIYHGVLTVNPAGGPYDRSFGTAMLKVTNWRVDVNPDSNGVFPATERVGLSFDREEEFFLEPGQLVSKRGGRVYQYRAKLDPQARGIRSLKITARRDGGYNVRLVLQGLNFSTLLIDRFDCRGFALVIGDDDFFSGVEIERKSENSKRFTVPGDCPPPDWPWVD